MRSEPARRSPVLLTVSAFRARRALAVNPARRALATAPRETAARASPAPKSPAASPRATP
jgi:hypothetical protein